MSAPVFEFNADHAFKTGQVVQKIRIYPTVARVVIFIQTGDMVIAEPPCKSFTWTPSLKRWVEGEITGIPWMLYLPEGAVTKVKCDEITTITIVRSQHIDVEDNVISMPADKWIVPWYTKLKYWLLRMMP